MAAKKNPASVRSPKASTKSMSRKGMRKAKGGAGTVSLSEIVVTKRTGGSGTGVGLLV